MAQHRVKSVEASLRDTEQPEHRLSRNLSALDLTVFGVGVIIGTGIFVLTGVVAKTQAGPAVALSFVVAGVVCGFAALCYAEFASTVPVAGSAYTFSYATFGEFIAWIIGWDLVLELALGAATVSVGWSGYFNQLLGDLGIPLPASIAGETATVNIPAMFIALLMTGVLVLGIKLSSRVTTVIVAIKIAIVLLVIVLGLFYVQAANYSPFVPPSQPTSTTGGSALTAPLIQLIAGFTPSTFGVGGIFAGAAIVFFAFIGFDIVATAAEETKNPKRDLPRGIIASLTVCTLLYVAVSLVVVGMQNYTELSTDAPLAEAFRSVGLPFVSALISVGALAGLTSVVMILMLGQSRVLFAMSRDHLLSPGLGAVHPRYRTPYRITIFTGIVVAVLGGLVPLGTLAELVNIGTLFAFVLVSIGVIVLRRTRPDLHRSFRVPWVPVLPILSAAACLWLMLNLPAETWLRFAIWMVIGLVLYFVYSRQHSRLAPGAAGGGEEVRRTASFGGAAPLAGGGPAGRGTMPPAGGAMPPAGGAMPPAGGGAPPAGGTAPPSRADEPR
ncbi:amino acid permease [Georgenia ruanii]|uniref:Amino acid permease n=1 Tax=Georgenia ruanii TaxID=348442 RepID=A0A7J9UYQ1_9MICO|nr:amino acid permease [Georgenia ruanii]MPV88804.1 amino acid permease [Georgenia ruanii]